MGRWQTRIAVAEKITDTLPRATDKTDKTPPEMVLSVSSVSSWSECRNFSLSEPVSSDAEIAAAEWEERAAVLEYDEGLPREEAERLAADQVAKLATRFAVEPRSTGLRTNPVARQPAASSALRPPDWFPEPDPGVRILRPAVEVPADEYDAHLDAMIAALPDGSPERNRLAFAKRRGWCVERDGERIFTKGRF